LVMVSPHYLPGLASSWSQPPLLLGLQAWAMSTWFLFVFFCIAVYQNKT
jgi:hypothetical protein